MELADIIKAINENPDHIKGIVAFSNETEHGKEVLKNFANVEFDKRIGDKISELHNRYDSDVFDIIGERKKTDQKTYDWIKEKMQELKTLRADKGGDKGKEISELKEKLQNAIESGSSNEFYKAKLTEATTAFDIERKELQDKLKLNEEQFVSHRVLADLTSGRSGIKFIDGLPDEAVNAMVKLNEEKIIKHAKIENDKVVYYQEDGTPFLNAEYKPATAKEVNEKLLGNIIDKGTFSKGGGGADAKMKNGKIITTGTGDNATKKLVLDASTFSTKVEFNSVVANALKEQGIAVSDKEYNQLSDAAYAEYEVSKLKLN